MAGWKDTGPSRLSCQEGRRRHSEQDWDRGKDACKGLCHLSVSSELTQRASRVLRHKSSKRSRSHSSSRGSYLRLPDTALVVKQALIHQTTVLKPDDRITVIYHFWRATSGTTCALTHWLQPMSTHLKASDRVVTTQQDSSHPSKLRHASMERLPLTHPRLVPCRWA